MSNPHSSTPAQRHNVPGTARFVRSLRFLARVRGWERLASFLAPPGQSGDFVVSNAKGVFAGTLASFIERRLYLFGGYEDEYLDLFRSFFRDRKRRIILDIGGNIGTHSIAFARDFESVHSFEPNPSLWPRFLGNVALSQLGNIRLHKTGLGDKAGELPFYLTANGNEGLGTVAALEQYDTPLVASGTVPIRCGDEVVATEKLAGIDAIKIDVQGFEGEVLAGLQATLLQHRPVVWMEVGAGTKTRLESATLLRARFPYPVQIFRFECTSHFPVARHSLCLASGEDLPTADYLIVPLAGATTEPAWPS